MQDSENKAKKKRGRPGLTDKRFWMKNRYREAVDTYATILAGKRLVESVDWGEAIEHLIETHPVTRKLLR